MNTKTSTAVVQRPVVDRLAFILPWGTSLLADQSKLIAPIQRRIKKEIDAGICVRAYPKGGRYRENFHINLHGGSRAFVQIGALQPRRQKGGIRVAVNPARFQPGDVEVFNAVMQRIIGRSYLSLLAQPLLNNIDFAVDVIGVRLDDILVAYSYAQRHTTFGKRIDAAGHIEGYNFGSVSSDYMTVAYDKSQERVHAAIIALSKSGACIESLKSNLVKQLKRAKSAPAIMRVEVRGKKLRGLHLAKLPIQPNRFSRFHFCDLHADGEKLSKLTRLTFLALCRQNGVKAALAAFKNTSQEPRVAAFWRSRQATWWKPDSIWKQACEAVYGIGLFPEEAFQSSR